jgi:nucleotide-binding universal stress UspA family protein
MKTIIAAVDFSPAALNAADYGAEMAMAIDAELLLLHVYSMPVGYVEVPIAFNEQGVWEERKKKLDDIKQKLVEKAGGRLSVETRVEMGSFFSVLKEVCEKVQPYAVLMGSQGTTATERLWLGGHTVHAMKNLDWPLLSIPPDVKFTSVKKIGLACDYNDAPDTLQVDEIYRLVNDFHAALHIINTGTEDRSKPVEFFATGLVQEMMSNLQPTYHFISTEDIDKEIMDFAVKNDIDLLIVLPRRHSLIDELMHRSHTKQLVLHCHVPVLALHSQPA